MSQSTRRLTLLLGGLLLWSGVLFGRLVWLQVFRHEEFRVAALKQQQTTIELPAPRGTLQDRDGQPLAMTLVVDSVAVDPQKITDINQAANVLASTLHLDRADLLRRLQTGKRRKSHFQWVARKLLPEEASKVRALNMEGLEFRKEMQRFYPHGSLAANVLGAVGFLKASDVTERGKRRHRTLLRRRPGGQERRSTRVSRFTPEIL
ncbi:MAG: hypothetical protein WDO18_00965 [Acidobacteriota bacterium]